MTPLQKMCTNIENLIITKLSQRAKLIKPFVLGTNKIKILKTKPRYKFLTAFFENLSLDLKRNELNI